MDMDCRIDIRITDRARRRHLIITLAGCTVLWAVFMALFLFNSDAKFRGALAVLITAVVAAAAAVDLHRTIGRLRFDGDLLTIDTLLGRTRQWKLSRIQSIQVKEVPRASIFRRRKGGPDQGLETSPPGIGTFSILEKDLKSSAAVAALRRVFELWRRENQRGISTEQRTVTHKDTTTSDN